MSDKEELPEHLRKFVELAAVELARDIVLRAQNIADEIEHSAKRVASGIVRKAEQRSME